MSDSNRPSRLETIREYVTSKFRRSDDTVAQHMAGQDQRNSENVKWFDRMFSGQQSSAKEVHVAESQQNREQRRERAVSTQTQAYIRRLIGDEAKSGEKPKDSESQKESPRSGMRL